MEINKELAFILKELKKAYAKYGSRFEQVHHKDSYDLVTNLDYLIEKYLVSRIMEEFPNDNIIGEELHKNNIVEGRNWTVDPIDGTVNLVNKIPIYGLQCSMIEDGVLKLGVIYFPEQDYICFAEKGKGAYGRQGALNCTLNTNLSDSVVTLGDFSHTNLERYNRQLYVLQKLAPKVAKIRMFGAASCDFFLLANGSTGAHIMYSRNLWDILPGLLIAQEAGAVITNLRGCPYSLEDDNLLVAANNSISNQILELVEHDF